MFLESEKNGCILKNLKLREKFLLIRERFLLVKRVPVRREAPTFPLRNGVNIPELREREANENKKQCQIPISVG